MRTALRLPPLALALVPALYSPWAIPALVSTPCTEDALLRAMPGGDQYDGSITFDCESDESCIEVFSGEIRIFQNLVIDGRNGSDEAFRAIGLTGNLEDKNPGFAKCERGDGPNTQNRLFHVEPGVNLTLKNLRILGFHASDFNPSDHSQSDDGGIILNHGSLELDNVSLGDGLADGRGGGIFNAGELTIRNSEIGGYALNCLTGLCFGATGNHSGLADSEFGGGGGISTIDELGGPATARIIDSRVGGNSVSGGNESGGGLYAASIHGHPVEIQIRRSEFSLNSSANRGGGIAIDSEKVNLVVEDSYFRNNVADRGAGGILIKGGTAVVNRTGLVYNRAGRSPGAIEVSTYRRPSDGNIIGGQLLLINSTVAKNRVIGRGVAGILSVDRSAGSAQPRPNALLSHVTVARNHIQWPDGESAPSGINLSSAGGGTIRIQNTIVAEPEVDTDSFDFRPAESSEGVNCQLYAGSRPAQALVAEGVNIDSDGSCIEATGADVAFLDGAATEAGLAQPKSRHFFHFLELSDGSRAIDAADATICTDPSAAQGVDQTGLSRVDPTAGESCDIGAVEYRPTPGPSASPSPSPQPTSTPSEPPPSPTPAATPTAEPDAVPGPSSTPDSVAIASSSSGSLDLWLLLVLITCCRKVRFPGRSARTRWLVRAAQAYGNRPALMMAGIVLTIVLPIFDMNQLVQ